MSIAETGALVLDSALWKYALVFYAREGVSDACLPLQDEAGVDIVELIFLRFMPQEALVAVRTARASPRRDRSRDVSQRPVRSLDSYC